MYSEIYRSALGFTVIDFSSNRATFNEEKSLYLDSSKDRDSTNLIPEINYSPLNIYISFPSILLYHVIEWKSLNLFT